MTNTFAYPKESRLLSSRDFSAIKKPKAKMAFGPKVRIKSAHNSFAGPRLGMSVSRKVGNAVIRNRLKRITRETFRVYRPSMRNLDLIVSFRFDKKLSSICDLNKYDESIRNFLVSYFKSLHK